MGNIKFSFANFIQPVVLKLYFSGGKIGAFNNFISENLNSRKFETTNFITISK